MGKCLNSRFVELVSIIANCRTPRRTLRPVSAAPPEIWLLPSPRIRFCSNLHLSKTLWEPEKAPGSAFLLSQVIRAWLQSTKCLSKESPRSEETKESDQFQIDVWDQFKTFALRAYQTDSCHAPIDFLVSYYWTNWHLPGFWFNIAYLGFIF